MHTVILTFKVSINANPKTIFDYLTDWEKQSDWILFTNVKKVSSGPNQKGTLLWAATGFGFCKFIDTMMVTEWQPNRTIVVEHTGRVVLGKGVFTINEIHNHECEFIWQEITPVPFGIVGRVGLVFVKPMMRLFFDWSLRKLKRNVEEFSR